MVLETFGGFSTVHMKDEHLFLKCFHASELAVWITLSVNLFIALIQTEISQQLLGDTSLLQMPYFLEKNKNKKTDSQIKSVLE